MDTQAISVTIGDQVYCATYYSSGPDGTKAIVFYATTPDYVVEALIELVINDPRYIHNTGRTLHGLRRDGCVYLEVPASQVPRLHAVEPELHAVP
jgi:hypothetical protein